MLKAEQIPIGVTAVFDAVWEMTSRTDKAIAAALNAWPGSDYVYRQPHRRSVSYSNPAIILPLPQEEET